MRVFPPPQPDFEPESYVVEKCCPPGWSCSSSTEDCCPPGQCCKTTADCQQGKYCDEGLCCSYGQRAKFNAQSGKIECV
ncbi:hypothetical protein ACTMTU_18355 [Streptomyces sp. OZ13]|uniref:hypothetical protein n=1 Tax=Streptomyces sp. OZ13 TaxID=3452210 RepID=UPI003F8BF199